MLVYFFLPDITHIQNLDFKVDSVFVLKRFVPRSNDVLDEQLDLSQFQVVISDSVDMCIRLQTVVLQVSYKARILCQHLKQYSYNYKISDGNRITQIHIHISPHNEVTDLNYWCLLYERLFCGSYSLHKYRESHLTGILPWQLAAAAVGNELATTQNSHFTVLFCMLQVLSSVLSSVMEYDRSIYNKLWVLLCDTLTTAPLKIKSQALKLAASIVNKVGFTMDLKVRIESIFYFLMYTVNKGIQSIVTLQLSSNFAVWHWTTIEQLRDKQRTTS
jgi:hypothetical protein